jgi:para-aminobenzoate synthetase component 1
MIHVEYPINMNHPANVRSAVLQVSPLDGSCSIEQLLTPLSKFKDPVLLESSASHPELGRYSMLACEPMDVLRLGPEGLLFADRTLPDQQDIWPLLEQAFACVKLRPNPDIEPRECPYCPGWMGYVGYEVGRWIEHLPCRARGDLPMCDMRLAFYDAILVHDNLQDAWELVELRYDDPPVGAGLAARALRSIFAKQTHADQCAGVAPPARGEAQLVSSFTPEAYRKAVRKCIEYIAAGDIFQVNLSQRFTIHDAPAPLDVYRALRRRNPAWYSAWLAFEDGGAPCAIVSSSPELFLRVRGGDVLTRPIKGTRPRTGEPAKDSANAEELQQSAKDNAELAMIIDLLRNDLGRVCRYGSVRVRHNRLLETHPTVFHLVGEVIGKLRPEIGPAALLRATFPGGSITGAPKVRAMEIIDEIEPVARGVYTGCIGWVGVTGDCEWNIAIRTIVCCGRDAYVQVGGGIVADSTPSGEYHETLDKARALLEAIAACAAQ